jgi:hypothetical protein
MKVKGRKKNRHLWNNFLKGFATIFDFTGHQVRRMFPDAFGYGEDTVTVSWKSVGEQIRKSMQDYSG